MVISYGGTERGCWSRGRVRLTFSIMDSLHGGLCTGYSFIKSFPILVKEREREEEGKEKENFKKKRKQMKYIKTRKKRQYIHLEKKIWYQMLKYLVHLKGGGGWEDIRWLSLHTILYYKPTIWTSNSTLRYLLKTNEGKCPHTKIHTCSGGIFYNTQEGSQMEKHKYHVILLICGN